MLWGYTLPIDKGAFQMNLIAELEAEQLAELGHNLPDFKAGDTIRVIWHCWVFHSAQNLIR